MPLVLEHVVAGGSPKSRKPLLQDVSAAFDDGTITLIIGRTGSGKTTLLQQLGGISPPSAGRILLDGKPLWNGNQIPRDHLLRLGLMFQFPEQQLFARSIRHEFDYSLKPYKLSKTERESRLELARSEWDPRRVFEPGRSPFALSGGERRRLALASSVAADPDWLLMDEPTAGVEAQGVRELLAFLERRRLRQIGGMVIATHDLDTFMPIADRVIVLQDGRIAADATPSALARNPRILLEAGVGVPSGIRIADSFAAAGLPLPCAGSQLTPEDTAAAIASLLKHKASMGLEAAVPNDPYRSKEELVSTGSAFDEARDFSPDQPHEIVKADPEGQNGETPTFWHRLDPRSKWLLYILAVTGAMLQNQWLGLIAAFVTVLAGYIGFTRPILNGAAKFARPLALFCLISIGLAGLTVHMQGAFPGFGFSAEQADATGMNIFRLLIVMTASFWFSATTPYGQMVSGLNWALSFGKKLKLPVESFALAVSLLFRFIPLIVKELQRFSIIVRARGKAPLRPGALRVQDVPALVVPMLLSLFHRAEDMTTAMELKRIGRRTVMSGSGAPLQWQRADSLTVMLGVLVLIVLVLVRDW